MIKKHLILIVLFCLSFSTSFSQNIVDNFDLPTHTFLKFNQQLINPSLSPFNLKKSEIVLHHRNQWSEYANAPKNYLISYNGNNYNNSGYGLSINQKTIGVWKSIGAIGNYAKAIELSEDNYLSLGFNVIGFNADIDRTKIITNTEDPLFSQYQKTTLLMVNPGVSMQLQSFNIGFYADNLVDYNFDTSKLQTPFSEKTFSGHLMYSTPKSESDNLFDNSYVTFIGRSKYTKGVDLQYTGGILYDLPKAGWIQGSYNSLYGVAAGVGFNLINKISLGYTYEKGIKDEITNLGPTHEFHLAYTFSSNDEEQTRAVKPKKNELDKTKTLEEEEIRRYKKKVYSKEIAIDNKISKEKTESFKKIAEDEDINYLLLPEKSGGIRKGYYIITNVFSDKTTAVSKMSDLRKKGLKKAGFFTTISGEWNYVFLERYDKFEDAKKAYSSNYNNQYKDIIWVLPIL